MNLSDGSADGNLVTLRSAHGASQTVDRLELRRPQNGMAKTI
jgi:hypothetical protein